MFGLAVFALVVLGIYAATPSPLDGSSSGPGSDVKNPVGWYPIPATLGLTHQAVDPIDVAGLRPGDLVEMTLGAQAPKDGAQALVRARVRSVENNQTTTSHPTASGSIDVVVESTLRLVAPPSANGITAPPIGLEFPKADVAAVARLVVENS